MQCQDGHNNISNLREFTKDGYGYCLTCRQYRKLIPETEGEQRLLIRMAESLIPIIHYPKDSNRISEDLYFIKKIEEEDNRKVKEWEENK